MIKNEGNIIVYNSLSSILVEKNHNKERVECWKYKYMKSCLRANTAYVCSMHEHLFKR